MPLSEREQRILEQLERELTSEDPKLATTMTDGPKASFGRVVIAIVGITVGLLLLILGVANSLPVVGVLGFAVMVGAVVYASTPSKTAKLQAVNGTGKAAGAKRPKAQNRASFTQRMEARWEKRQNGE